MSENSHRYLKAFKMAYKYHSGVSDRQKLLEVLVSQGANASEVDVNSSQYSQLKIYYGE